MFDADSFQNIILVVKACVAAGRADLIESALVDRLHVSEVHTRIEAERAGLAPARPAAAPGNSARLWDGGPTREQADALAEATRKRSERMYHPERTAQPDPLATAIEARFRTQR
jgi:hypothetical protein